VRVRACARARTFSFLITKMFSLGLQLYPAIPCCRKDIRQHIHSYSVHDCCPV